MIKAPKTMPSVRSAGFAAAILLSIPANAQISLTSAVDLALRTSPKVKIAQADVDKAFASLQESKDVYIPAVNGGAGLGDAFGYSTNPPTLFTITAQSLVFNSAQHDYIRSARAGLDSAQLSLKDARSILARDTALAFIAVEHDQQRQTVLQQEFDYATRLVDIQQERLAAGLATQIDLTTSRLTAAQFRLSRLRSEDLTAEDREHLARLIGLPPKSLLVTGDLPPMPSTDLPILLDTEASTPAVDAAFASARAKQEQAFGDARFLYRPQVILALQYNRYATFTGSFATLTTIYGKVGANEEAFGVQITIPFLDKARQARARESAADAARSFHEAEYAQFLTLDSRSKLSHSLAELHAQAEVAQLDQQLAQQQLEAITTQLNTATPSSSAQPLTPKDEQNQRLAEREKYLAYLDATYQLQQAQINLLHEAGRIEDWLRQAVRTQP